MALGPAMTVKMAEMTPKCPMMNVSYLAPPSQQLTKETCVISPTLQMSD